MATFAKMFPIGVDCYFVLVFFFLPLHINGFDFRLTQLHNTDLALINRISLNERL